MAKSEASYEFQNFLQNYPPYKVINFNYHNWDLIIHEGTLVIEQFCSKCGKVRSFKTKSLDAFLAVHKNFDEANRIAGLMGKHIVQILAYYKVHFPVLEFSCQHDCGEEHAIPLLIQGETVMKIGQYPTFSKIEVEEGLKKYKNIISKYYPELTKSVSCYSQNMGIPAFVYLRRILEHLVDEKYKKLGNVKEDEKFIDKLKKVEETEEIIPIELESIKSQIYIVLSKGVHEYEEKECLLLYDSVKFVIESILDKEVQKKERAQKAVAAQQAIQAKLKEKDDND